MPKAVNNPPVIKVSLIEKARKLLRAKNSTTQAGFTAERIPARLFRRRPILIDDGPLHDEHRRQLTRFFAPRVLAESHSEFINQTARDAIQEAKKYGECNVEDVALLYSVRVASHIVGLTEGPPQKLAQRLTEFFQQPPVDHTLPDYGRTQKQWIQAARNALGPLIKFYFADVRPAIKARKKQPQDDIISHLIERGFRSSEILMECLTYGTAGMVTTREFISMCMWRMLNDKDLRNKFLQGDSSTRNKILHEIIRLEPPVGHLYRRVQKKSDACPFEPGSLIDIDVRATNQDPILFGDDAEKICPSRDLTPADRPGLSFGDGAHRCPGSWLAMLETEVLLLEFLQADPQVLNEPDFGWDSLIQGYQLRNFIVAFPKL